MANPSARSLENPANSGTSIIIALFIGIVKIPRMNDEGLLLNTLEPNIIQIDRRRTTLFNLTQN